MSQTTPDNVSEEERPLSAAPLSEHLAELRTRLVRGIVVVVVAVVAAWFFHETLFEWLMEPYTIAMKNRHPDVPHYIQYRALTEPFVVYLKTSAIVGGLVAMPYLIYEMWRFVVPGLYKEERQMATSFLFATIVFFFGGVLFCRYLVLGPAVNVLLGIGATNTSAAIMMNEYFSFTSRILFVFGLLFELPVVISFLSFLGIITHRTLWKHWRSAVVVVFIVGAMLTPPDPLTQMLLSVPLVFLYFVSMGVAWFFTTRREARQAAAMED